MVVPNDDTVDRPSAASQFQPPSGSCSPRSRSTSGRMSSPKYAPIATVRPLMHGSTSPSKKRWPACSQRQFSLTSATVSRAASDERAGLITAIYVVSYLATGIPAVLAGIATSHFGLHKTALVYSVAVAVLAAAAVSLLIRQMASGRPRRVTHHPDVPPGPGTVPPCPPTSPRLGEAST